MWIRIGAAALLLALIVGVALGVLVNRPDGEGTPPANDLAVSKGQDPPSAGPATTAAATTTTTIPPIVQPGPAVLPPVPGGVVQSGANSPEIAAYEQRLHDLEFDPGPVDGKFDGKTRYAVHAVEKVMGWGRDGTIDQQMVDVLSNFQYPAPLSPDTPDRVEIDLDKQVLTVYRDWQISLISTTSTGNGKKFCGGADGCQYAITPTGRYEFQWHVNGWRDGDLGRLYNPWYFNGGIAVHGYNDVPTGPASHGCARIPMHTSEHFGDLVSKGMAVYVLGTQAPASGGPLPPDNGSPTTTTTVAPPTTPAPAPAAPPPPAPTAPPTAPPTTPPPTTEPPTTTTTTTTTTVPPPPTP